MRVLVLNWRDIKHPRAGGAEVRLHHVYEGMVARGHQVKLISTKFDEAPLKENINGVEVERSGSDVTYPFLCMANIKKWEQSFKADVVVEDLNKLPMYTPLFSKKPKLIQMHHLWLKSIFKEASFVAASIVYFSEKTIGWFYKKQKFCVVSDSTKDELSTLGVSKNQIDIIYNGTDLDYYKVDDSIDQKSNYILWLSRMQKYKGPVDAIRAFSKIKDKSLVLKMAGDGPFLEEVKNEIQALDLKDRVELLGFVSKEKKRSLLQNAKVLLQTSYKEGWGLTVTEAGACGCPVIAANSPGLRDSVKENLNGILYTPGDITDLISKMDYLLGQQSLLDQLSAGGVEWSKKFTWSNASVQTEQLLNDVLGPHE